MTEDKPGDNTNDDIDLSEAIASSINELKANEDSTDDELKGSSQNQNKQIPETLTPHNIYDNDNNETELENAIGDAFNQFYFGQDNTRQDDDIQAEEYVQSSESSFGINKDDGHKDLTQIDSSASELRNYEESTQSTTEHSGKDTSLMDAINVAFESAEKHKSDKDQENDNNLTGAIDNAFDEDVISEADFQQNLEKTESKNATTTHNENDKLETVEEEFDLESVIGNAFESAMKSASSDKDRAGQVNNFQDGEELENSNALDLQKKIPEFEKKTNKEIRHDYSNSAKVDQSFEEAIGNAFNEIMNDSDYAISQEGSSNISKGVNKIISNLNNQDDKTHEKKKIDDNELDLDEAIGNAFKSLLPMSSEPNQECIPSKAKAKRDDTGDSDIGLEKVIGNALKSIQNNQEIASAGKVQNDNLYMNNEKETSIEAGNDEDLNEVISSSFKQILSENDSNVGVAQPAKMQEPSYEHNTVASKTKHSGSVNEVMNHKDGPQIDLSSIVQNIFNQMANTDEKISDTNNPISEDVLQELALEITNQVQNQIGEEQSIKKQNIINMPQIDDNVLAHFQNEAYKDENHSLEIKDSSASKLPEDSSIQAALANVVRNAIESNATTLSDSNESYLNSVKRSDQNEADLEQLQINDILQNAFNMAMENPHDLLSNLEMEEDEGTTKHTDEKIRKQPDYIANALAKLPHPLPASTTTFLESLNTSNDIDLNFPGDKKSKHNMSKENGKSNILASQSDRLAAVAKNIMNNLTYKSDDPKKKSLSIAETLAFHRSSMTNGPRKDYSSIDSLEEALRSDNSQSSSINSKVSSVLSTLSSRIHTSIPGSENNLLQVIRQMTNALTSSPQPSYMYPSGIPSVTDIISSYKGSDNEKNIIKCLLTAKKFLGEKQFQAHNDKASSLIDNVLDLFGTDLGLDIDPSILGSSYHQQISNVKSEFISSICNSVVSAISNFSSSRGGKSNSLLGEKPKVDSPEYKERIRLENRERKKKWREENAERNKDNDLRSRVLKRAAAMFGEADSSEKKSWADEEFNRRRDKRIAKQKKDEQEKDNKLLLNDRGDKQKIKNKESDSLARDPNLFKPVTDMFNIFTGLTHREGPQAALAATSAATATAAAIYASNNSTTDVKVVDGAVSIILTSLMDNSNSAGQQERIASLSRGATSSFKLNTSGSAPKKQPSLPSKFPDPELSSLINNTQSGSGLLNRFSTSLKGLSTNNLPHSLLQLQKLNIGDGKRKSVDSLSHEHKRQRSTSPLLTQSENRNHEMDYNEKESISKIVSNLDQLRNSISANTSHLWGSRSALKMPHYKKPELQANSISFSNPSQADEASLLKPNSETSSVSLSGFSPFISHKVGFGSGTDDTSNSNNKLSLNSGSSPGLRKPGSFQKPSFSKPDKTRGRSLGFPPLYSTSFKQK